eukprot:3932956-Rhodomonas_salina.1
MPPPIPPSFRDPTIPPPIPPAFHFHVLLILIHPSNPPPTHNLSFRARLPNYPCPTLAFPCSEYAAG